MNSLRTRLRTLLGSIEVLDLVLVIGIALLAYGLSMLHPALPYIAVGLLLLAAWAGIGRTTA